MEIDPSLEDWVDELNIDLLKGVPPDAYEGTRTSGHHTHFQASPIVPQDAPHIREEAHIFDEDTYEFSVSPEPSPINFEHWEVSNSEVDFDWDKYENFTKAVKKRLRKECGKLFYVGMASICSDEEIDWNMRYYNMEGIWARPLDFMRPNIFNYGKNFKIPRMVTSPKLMSLGVGAPLHPYLRRVIKMYDVAPLQLSPNSYKLVLAFLYYILS